jgi:hypothetical protein
MVRQLNKKKRMKWRAPLLWLSGIDWFRPAAKIYKTLNENTLSSNNKKTTTQ